MCVALLVLMQTTIRKEIEIKGIGLHSGDKVTLTIAPSDVNHGVTFNGIDALWNNVIDTRMCSVLGANNRRVGMVEHIMAALYGLGIDNADIKLDADEVPLMDGSSKPFVDAINAAGIKPQHAPRRVIKVLKTVEVEKNGAKASLTPSEIPHFECSIDFEHKSIGKQSSSLSQGNFARDLSDCRTFGFAHEVEAMRAAGLARGGSLENAVVLDDEGVMNKEGLRRRDEFARHKLLDAVGDMALCGGVLLASYSAHRPSHELNNILLRTLFADESAFEIIDLHDAQFGVLVHKKQYIDAQGV